MKILAIDPGPTESAYVVWDGARVVDKAIAPNAVILAFFAARLEFLQADHCAIEMIASYGMPVGAEVFETCVWIGRFIQQWSGHGSLDLVRIPRKEICVHLCGSARAKDANIRQALIDRLGAPGTAKKPGPTHGVSGDIWAALAVAVCAYDRLQVEGR